MLHELRSFLNENEFYPQNQYGCLDNRFESWNDKEALLDKSHILFSINNKTNEKKVMHEVDFGRYFGEFSNYK